LAGDWIKMRTNLRDDPAVIGIGNACGLDEDTVVGKLHRLWSWADQQTTDGNASSVTLAWLDRYVSAPGFAQALCAQGWLSVSDAGITIPNFECHNGETGKRRALTAKRSVKARNADVTLAALRKAHLEKRREEVISGVPEITSALERARSGNGYPPEFSLWYAAYPRHIGKRAAARAWKACLGRVQAAEHVDEPEAVSILLETTQRFAKSPKGRDKQFCPYPATWLNGDRWNDDPAEWGEASRVVTAEDAKNWNPTTGIE